MIFHETKLAGVRILELQRHEDSRGWFARSWCTEEFQAHGLRPDLSQCSISFNKTRGTLRGMHWQADPHPEAKLVRCTRGALFDVALDMRPDSATYLQWTSVELSEENGRSLYIPEGCAHGFQTLMDDTEVLYSIAGSYHPESSRGMRWDDPASGISWPLPDDPILNDRDRNWPLMDTKGLRS